MNAQQWAESWRNAAATERRHLSGLNLARTYEELAAACDRGDISWRPRGLSESLGYAFWSETEKRAYLAMMYGDGHPLAQFSCDDVRALHAANLQTCSDDCQGWCISTSDRHGVQIEKCDECWHDYVAEIRDEDVQQLPEAQAELARVLAAMEAAC